MAQSRINPEMTQAAAPARFYPTPQECREIAVKATCMPRTVQLTYRNPAGVRSITLHRIVMAAAELGYPGPGGPVRPRKLVAPR